MYSVSPDGVVNKVNEENIKLVSDMGVSGTKIVWIDSYGSNQFIVGLGDVGYSSWETKSTFAVSANIQSLVYGEHSDSLTYK